MPRTRILVSNDDGIRAPGLQTLVKELHSCEGYDVRVGAPESERSGASHAVTSRVEATLYTDGTAVGLPSGVVCYAASGYPSDAVRLAFQSDIFGRDWVPDVVVSGMNRGINAGRALVVSGTVAAAREGIFQGSKALAVSLHSFSSRMHDKEDYTYAVRDLLPILDWFVAEKEWPPGVILNINIPHEKNEGVVPKCMMVVPQGRSFLTYSAIKTEELNPVPGALGQTKMYKFRWQVSMDPDSSPENDDFVAVMNNFVTLTPVPIGPGDDVTGAMKLLHGWRETWQHPSLQWSLPN